MADSMAEAAEQVATPPAFMLERMSRICCGKMHLATLSNRVGQVAHWTLFSTFSPVLSSLPQLCIRDMVKPVDGSIPPGKLLRFVCGWDSGPDRYVLIAGEDGTLRMTKLMRKGHACALERLTDVSSLTIPEVRDEEVARFLKATKIRHLRLDERDPEKRRETERKRKAVSREAGKDAKVKAHGLPLFKPACML